MILKAFKLVCGQAGSGGMLRDLIVQYSWESCLKIDSFKLEIIGISRFYTINNLSCSHSTRRLVAMTPTVLVPICGRRSIV